MKPSKVRNLIEFVCEGIDLLKLDDGNFRGIRLRSFEVRQTIGIEVSLDANFVLWRQMAYMTDGDAVITNEEPQ